MNLKIQGMGVLRLEASKTCLISRCDRHLQFQHQGRRRIKCSRVVLCDFGPAEILQSLKVWLEMWSSYIKSGVLIEE